MIEWILRYVDAHYCEEINRNDLANLVYISTDYCSRIFRREIGKSLAGYVLTPAEYRQKLLDGTQAAFKKKDQNDSQQNILSICRVD